MAISIIPFQPIRFRTTDEIAEASCECSEKNFCQLVNENDDTTFQISASNEVTNNSFETDLTDWSQRLYINSVATITNATTLIACDGAIALTSTGGTGPYTYSIDGGATYASSPLTALCAGCYNVISKDSLGNIGILKVCISVNENCGAYASPDLYDLLTTDLSNLFNCELNDLI